MKISDAVKGNWQVKVIVVVIALLSIVGVCSYLLQEPKVNTPAVSTKSDCKMEMRLIDNCLSRLQTCTEMVGQLNQRLLIELRR